MTGWVNVHDDLYFLDDDRGFVWKSERDGFAHLYMFDMNGDMSHQVTTGDWALRASGGAPGMSQSVSHIDEEARIIYFTALEKASTERHLYRVGFDGNDMQRISAADGVHSIRFSADGKHYLDASSALDRPPSLAVHTIADDQPRMIADTAQRFPSVSICRNGNCFRSMRAMASRCRR